LDYFFTYCHCYLLWRIRSSAGSVGAGWIIYRKLQLSLEIVQKDFCNFGDHMEVFDAELHAAYEGLQCIISRDICDPGYIHLCIDNSSAIDVLADNPNQIEGAFKTTDAGNTLIRNGLLRQSGYQVIVESKVMKKQINLLKVVPSRIKHPVPKPILPMRG
jgi:hypothetical protein